MNCLRCNTPNESGAKFCKNCGMDMTYVHISNSTTSNKDIYLLLTYIGTNIITTIYYLLLDKVIRQFIKKDGSEDWETMNRIYEVSNWVLNAIDIIIFITLIILVNNKTVRIWLIIFAAIRLIANIIWFLPK